MTKYKLTDETIKTVTGKTLYRIQALRDFANVKADVLGGFVESEKNLSHDGKCWVFENAKVFGNARVSGNAEVFDNTQVYDDARVSDNAQVYDDARVCDHAQVSDNAEVSDNAHVFGNARVSGNAQVYGKALVFGDARVFSNGVVSGNAQVNGHVWIWDTTYVFCDARVSDLGWSWGDNPVATPEDQKQLASEILDAIKAGGKLKMDIWHTCSTTHCLAGWAQCLRENVCSGDFGSYEAGVKYLPSLAPYFYSDDETAMQKLIELAG